MQKNQIHKPTVSNSQNHILRHSNEYIAFRNNPAVNKSVKMDNALEEYYLKTGRTDYRNDRGKGRFLQYFEQEKYECDDMEDELGYDAQAQDCSYIEFDDSFPLPSSIKTGEQRQKEIFRILQLCYTSQKTAKTDTVYQLTDNFMKRYRIGDNIYDLKLNLLRENVTFGLRMYNKQCKYSFGNKALTDNGMAYAFAVGVSNHNFPFLQTILDIYMRDSLQRALSYNRYVSNDPIYDIRTLNDYSILEWAEKYDLKSYIVRNSVSGILNYKHYLKCNIYDGILSGIDKYLRICPRLHINPLMLIKDDIYEIAQYFLLASEVIKHVSNDEKDINFQFDFAIACQTSVQKKGSCFPMLWNDGTDEELEYSKNEIDGGIKWTTEELQDCIGDIHCRLQTNNCAFANRALSVNRRIESVQVLQKLNNSTALHSLVSVCRKYLLCFDESKYQNNISSFASFAYRKHASNPTLYYDRLCDEIERLKILSLRDVMDSVCSDMNVNRIIFEILDYEMSDESIYLLLNNLISKNMKNNYSESIQENKLKILDSFAEFKNKLQIGSAFAYPNMARFCAIVDRRKQTQTYADTINVFQPKQNKFIPRDSEINVLPEWHLNAIQTSFLPSVNWNEHSMGTIEKEINDKPITSHSLCNGSLLMLSFIVESKDVIKCYLFRDSTFIRFLPSDIIDILPKLFLSSYKNNAKFEKDYVSQMIVNKMQFKDKNFEYWYRDSSE